MRPREACEDVVNLILCRAREHQDELVAAEPCQQVSGPQRCRPDPREFDEQAVTGSAGSDTIATPKRWRLTARSGQPPPNGATPSGTATPRTLSETASCSS